MIETRSKIELTMAVATSFLLATTGLVGGQQTDICSCAPNTYEFTLDFSLFCPPVNITIGDAVTATSCLVNPFADPSVTDLIPVAVQTIDILELNQNLLVRSQETIDGNFGDGDTFQYASYVGVPGQVNEPADLPRAIQLNIIGTNAADEQIINVFIITFSNNCGTYPVLSEGMYAGWTRFSDLGPPDREYCPVVPTDSPTAAPSSTTPEPTPPPVVDPTPAPTPVSTPEFSMSMSMDLNIAKSLEGYFDAAIDEFGLDAEFGVDSTTRSVGAGSNGKGSNGSKGSKAGKSDDGKGSKGSKSTKSDDAKGSKDSKSDSGKGSKGSKSTKSDGGKGSKGSGKGGKGSKGEKNEKRDKAESKKDTEKLSKDESRRL